MATQYFILSTKQAALAQSQDFWEKVLGRAKLASDTTQYLCSVMTNPNTGQSMLIVDDASYAMVYPKLTQQQKTFVDSNLVGASDPRVIAIKASQPTPPGLPSSG